MAMTFPVTRSPINSALERIGPCYKRLPEPPVIHAGP
ncbi:hypothetical protein OOU_Y34scaffold01190g1 [Pyricularia oryzae Y34]|uniref:Uncharacterized protein n=1 Tax=Pyricularia oryzae (strain Y34) TaxID=1143189 RepID=A0AA97PF59_PYRO3|nr:hypothetical protein OOU_Y34scaffold01190g1 [Pyricularia oryzae Y34]